MLYDMHYGACKKVLEVQDVRIHFSYMFFSARNAQRVRVSWLCAPTRDSAAAYR